MSNSSQRKIGVILSYVSEAIKILSGLIYTPIMLRLLGQSEYGLYQLVYSVVSYLGLLSLGFSSSYMRFYSRYNEKNDQDGIARLNGIFLTIFLTISLICVLCGVVMVSNCRAIFGTGLSNTELETAKILMSLMIVNLALTFPNTVFDCCVTAHERFFFQKILIVAQNLLNPFLTLPLLIIGYGSVGMVCVTTSITLAKLIIDVWFCLKKLEIQFVFKGFQFSLFKEMWIFTFFIFLNQIIDQINWSVDKFLLGRISGTVAVALYGVGSQINTMYVQFSTAVSNVFVPRVNEIVARSSNDEELTVLFIKVGRIQFIIMGLILTGFVFLGKPFILFWAGESYAEAYIVVLFLILPATVPLIQNLGIEIQRAKNKHKVRSVVYFFVSIANVFVSLPLIKVWGPTGAAFGTAISLFVGNILFINWYYQKRLGIDVVTFWKEIAKFIPALICPCALGVCMVRFGTIENFIILFIWIILYTAVYCISMYFWGMNEDEKNMILIPVKKLLQKK